ncbi:MAG: hypothetical protein NC489_43195 [Ruminococcus flavefaciens]|nr:hypothetical protein [Ruminococcus flavefaciens]
MSELLEKYVDRFNENFPLFMVMNMGDEEVEALIQKCLDDGTPYHPDDSDPETLY